MRSQILKYFILTLVCFTLTNPVFSQFGKEESKTVSGIVSFEGKPLKDVHISVQKSDLVTRSSDDGSYAIETRIGDRLQFSSVGFKTITILIEDVTSTLNINMFIENNLLEEAVVRAKRSGKALEVSQRGIREFESAIGTINPQASGFDIDYVDGTSLNPGAPNLAMALNGKVPGLFATLNSIRVRKRGVLWDIDGMLERGIPIIDVTQVRDVYILRNPPAAYGTKSAIIIVRTINAPEILQDQREALAEQYRNQNYYEDDATSLDNNSVINSSPKDSNQQRIRGTVSYDDQPLESVHIRIKGSTTVTTSDSNGEYIIAANPGQILEFTHISFKKVAIIIEDTSEVLNIAMSPKTEILDESIVKASLKKGKTLERALKSEEEFVTSRGQINPKTAGYSVGFVEGAELSNTYANIQEALEGKISNYSYDRVSGKVYLRGRGLSILNSYPATWEVDGVFTTEAPNNLDLSEIENVYALKSVAATNKYGQDGAGGVIVIKTKYGNYSVQKKRNDLTQRYTNQNYYYDDAQAFSEEQLQGNQYLKDLVAIDNKQEAIAYYNGVLTNQLKNFGQHISVAQKFKSHFKDEKVANNILMHLAHKYEKNAEILKAVAYQYQTFGMKKPAIELYEKIIRLRPNYAQSFRDLANAYLENEQFQKAWRLYMNYLLRGNDVSGEGIGQIIYNEMEWLYFVRNNQTRIKERFSPKNKSIDEFRNDVRIIVEWNTSEAEFDLEFVNPEKRAYVFEHSLEKNEALIIDEKTKGYTSKEFFIEDIGEGEWLVNLTYFGNKKPAPTYFKVSIFTNWGRHNQSEKISNYKFEHQKEKIQLLKINQQSL